MPKRRVKVVAVGTGLALEAHLLGYRRCRFIKLHGIVSQRDRELPHRLGVGHYPSLQAALDDPQVEAVDLVVPTHLHADMASAAIAQGKHVLVEKPVDADLAKARELIAKIAESDLVISGVSQFRFSPGVDELAHILDRGLLGELLLCEASLCIHRDRAYYDLASWRNDRRLAGGGVLLMNGIHLIDVLISLLGVPQVSAARMVCTRDYIQVEDLVSVSLIFETGVLATLNLTSHAQKNYPTRICLTGSRGKAVLSEYRLIQLEIDGEKQRCKGRGLSTEQFFRAQLEDFGAAIVYGKPSQTPIKAGLLALEVVHAAYAAAHQH